MILNINKPAGITSHDVVNAVRKFTGEKRVGHAGTLDPFATGVLVVAVGREDTKKLGEINEQSKKEYVALLELGKTSTTGDPEGIIQETSNKKQVTKGEIEKILKRFVGDIVQTPPAFSAIKIQGYPAYKRVKQGEQVKMPPRQVTIYEIYLLESIPPLAKIRVVCSAGTYIRSLAKDIGEALGTDAYLRELTRTRVGAYKIQDSKTLDELKKLVKNKS